MITGFIVMIAEGACCGFHGKKVAKEETSGKDAMKNSPKKNLMSFMHFEGPYSLEGDKLVLITMPSFCLNNDRECTFNWKFPRQGGVRKSDLCSDSEEIRILRIASMIERGKQSCKHPNSTSNLLGWWETPHEKTDQQDKEHLVRGVGMKPSIEGIHGSDHVKRLEFLWTSKHAPYITTFLHFWMSLHTHGTPFNDWQS